MKYSLFICQVHPSFGLFSLSVYPEIVSCFSSCSWFQAGKTDSDHLYFMRKHYDILSNVHCHSLDRDTSFSTLHDSSVAEILANKLLTHYLSTEIDALSEKLHLKFTSIIESKLLQWTESKVSLAESEKHLLINDDNLRSNSNSHLMWILITSLDRFWYRERY